MNFRIQKNLSLLSAGGGGKKVQLLLKHSGKMASSFHVLGVSSSSVTLCFFRMFECAHCVHYSLFNPKKDQRISDLTHHNLQEIHIVLLSSSRTFCISFGCRCQVHINSPRRLFFLFLSF